MIKILKINIYDKNINVIVKYIINNISKVKNNLISATGAHGVITAHKDNYFFNILNSFDFNLPDGMPNVWLGKLKGAKKMERCYGPDFFKETIIKTAPYNINHFFCGGKDGVAEELKVACEKKFNNFNVVGTYSPPFREMTDEELNNLANKINVLNTNIVWIGLSTPKQEKFAFRLSKFTNVNFICTVGAAFDFHTEKVKQAPKWIQKIALEWFYRLLMEPRRLWKRYFEIVPLFIFYNILEIFKGEFFNNNSKEK